RTMTASPALNPGAIDSVGAMVAALHFGDLAAKLVDADLAALDEALGDAVNPALVIGHLVISVRTEAFDVAAKLVDGHAPFLREQHQHCVHPLFPERVVVLGAFDCVRGLAAHVVMAAKRRMSCVGHQTASASFIRTALLR